jgi:murein DD-endopeptidase MepM/ murein hydrolase activator NlpD
MAVQLLAGLARAGAGVGRVAARSGAKKLAIKKVKSFAEDKVKGKIKGKLSKKSELISSEGDQQQQKLKYSSMGGGLTPTLTGTTDSVKIKSAKSSKSQVEQLKINVTNIHSFLVKSNKQYKKQEADTRRNEKVQQNKAKLRGEERRLEKGSSPLAKSASTVKDAVASTGSIFEKVLEFGALLLTGILVNALPAIIKKVEEIIDNIVNFLTPIQSGFNLIKAFFTGELDKKELDVDKKRVDDALTNINGEGGLIDQLAEKAGPLEGLIKTLKPAIELVRGAVGGKKMVLAKKGGKEGVLNKETGEFTERQFTAGERKKYDTDTSMETPTEMDNNIQGVDGSGLVVTSQMGMRKLALSPGMHMGVDIAGPEGTPLIAFSSGKVNAVGYDKGYGNYIAWSDDKGVEHFYGHMKHPAKVSVNQDLKKGQVIGLMGNTGRSSGPHLHWETSTVAGDTGRPKGAVLSRFNPLSKYGKNDPFKIQNIPSTSKSSTGKSKDNKDGQGGGLITPIKSDNRLSSINQPMDDEGTTTIAVQQVNTIQTAYVPMPIPMRSRSTGSTSSPTLSPIWSA